MISKIRYLTVIFLLFQLFFSKFSHVSAEDLTKKVLKTEINTIQINNTSRPVTLQGVELCNQVFIDLKKQGPAPFSQTIFSSDSNTFPYNILLQFTGNSKSHKKLVLIFSIEQYEKNKELIQSISKNIENHKFDYEIELLISYGDNQIPEKQNSIKGTELYFSSLPSIQDITAVIINTDSAENSLTYITSEKTSPMWILKNAFEVMEKSELQTTVPKEYISQMNKYADYKKTLLEYLFPLNIPAIQFNFNLQSENLDETEKVIINFLELYEKTANSQWDEHCIMFHLFGKTIWITETNLIQLLISSTFILFFAFFYFCVSKKNVLKRLQKLMANIWHVPFIIFVILVFLLILGNKFSFHLFSRIPVNDSIFLWLLIQLTLTFIFVFSFFINQINFFSRFREKSLQIQIVAISFLNLLIFSLFDITVFPIFLSVFLVSLVCFFVFTKSSGIISLFITFFCYLPYLKVFFTLIDIKKVEVLLLGNPFFIIGLSLISTQVLLQIFKILLHYKRRNYNIYITALIFYILSVATVLYFSLFYKNNRSLNSISSEHITITHFDNPEHSLIKIKKSDNVIFNDTIRTLEIHFSEQPVQCEVNIFSSEGQPVLYSDNDYIMIDDHTNSFSIPYYPPKEMTFNYGTSCSDTDIIVKAVFETETNHQFYSEQQIIKTH